MLADTELVGRTSFAGHPSSLSGPVPGATIHATSLDRPLPGGATAVSDFHGRFTLELPSWQQIDAEATRCATGSLTPGGTLGLSLDGD